MRSTRVSVGLCIVMLFGVVAGLPAAVTAQQDQVVLTVALVDDGRSVGGGVDVTATWDGGSANETTLADGRVRFEVPRGANVSVRVTDDRYIRNIPYVIRDATEQSVDVPVAESGMATITVRNTANETVEDARVLLYRSGRFITDQRTGADGTVTTPAVEQGSYRLTIQKSGYYDNRSRITVGSRTEVSQSIEQGEVDLLVSVQDDYFEAPETLDASVRIPGIGTLETGSDGDTTFRVPVNTRYDLTVTKDGYDEVQQTVSVGESDTNTTVSLDRVDRLDTSAPNQTVINQPVTIEVTDEYDEPVNGATVTLDGQQVDTTENGTARVTPGTAGPVTYTIDDGDTSTTISIEVFDPDGGTPTATATPTATPTATATPAGTSSSDGPGFTPVTVVAALALFSLVAYRRR